MPYGYSHPFDFLIGLSRESTTSSNMFKSILSFRILSINQGMINAFPEIFAQTLTSAVDSV